MKLTGYRYQSKTKNRISRSESIKAMDRVDVIAWESESAGLHATQLKELKASDFKNENYTACLWDGNP